MADHLVLVRHAKAEDLAEAPDDLSRRLTWSGEHASRYAMGRVAPLVERDLGEGPVQVWTSGAVRARQTAEAAAKALGLGHDDVRVADSLTASDADAFLSELAAAEGTVVAVGHNPFAERLVRQECGSELRFGKAAAACLAPAAPGAGHGLELEWFVQGPADGRWEALASLLEALTRAGKRIGSAARSLLDDPEDAETLHQYRISLRVARSLLAFGKPYLRRGKLREANDALRALQAPTSELRELDVMVAQLQAEDASSSYADAAELLSACSRQRVKVRGRFFEGLSNAMDEGQVRHAVCLLRDMGLRAQVERDGVPASELRERYLALAKGCQDDLASCDLADAEAVHAIRKRSKTLRYVARELSGTLGEGCEQAGAKAKSMQGLLGELCDARVSLGIAEGLRGRGAAEPAGAGETPTFAQAQRARIEGILGELAAPGDAEADEGVAEGGSQA